MLILSRRPGQSIIVGDDVVITLRAIKGRQAWIGVDAPTEISVHRSEIYQRIQREKLNMLNATFKVDVYGKEGASCHE